MSVVLTTADVSGLDIIADGKAFFIFLLSFSTVFKHISLNTVVRPI